MKNGGSFHIVMLNYQRVFLGSPQVFPRDPRGIPVGSPRGSISNRIKAWPETLQDARRRFALRFLQYLQRGIVAKCLGPRCRCPGDASGMPWGCLGDALGMPWGCLGNALGMGES